MKHNFPALIEGVPLGILRQLDQDGACTRVELGEPSDALRQALCRLKKKGFVREAVLITAEGRAALLDVEAEAEALAARRRNPRPPAQAVGMTKNNLIEESHEH
jgi:hypothetical protein